MNNSEIGNGSVTISTKEYVMLIDKSRVLENLKKNLTEYSDEKARQQIENLRKLYTTAYEERLNAIMEAQKLRQEIQRHTRIPYIIRKFFNAI